MGQQTLPFAEADAARSESWNDVYRAILAVDHEDLHLYQFVRIVYLATAGGQVGQLVASHKQLRGPQPRGIMCGAEKERATVALAAAAGIVEIIENRHASGGQAANGYRINWPGVRRLTQLATTDEESPDPGEPGVSETHPLGAQPQAPVSETHPPGAQPQANAHALRAKGEYNPSCNSSSSSVVDDVDETDLEWVKVLALADSASREGWAGERLDDADRRFVLAAAMLAAGRFGEDWLTGAAAIARRHPIRGSRRRFLRGVLATRCAEILGVCEPGEPAKVFLDRELARYRGCVDRYFRYHSRKAAQ